MVIDRMELADLGNSLLIAKAVLKQLGDITPPIPIDEIAKASGITEIREVQTEGFEGALLAPDHKQDGIILVSRRAPRQRRRFTIGHELGHLLNFWHKPPEGGFRCTAADMFGRGAGGDARVKMEVEANEFAAEMLMPEHLFRRDLAKLKSPGLEHIVDLAEHRYDTSKLATARRFVDLIDDGTAIILSKDGVIELIDRNKEFPFIELRRGQAIPAKSQTAHFNSNNDRCSAVDETDYSLWTAKPLAENAEMYEQVLVQSGGYRITLLTLDESDCDDEDEEYVRQRSERQPRFR